MFSSSQRWIIYVCITILVMITFGNIINAQWNVIDDHEIAAFLGPDASLHFSEIFPTLQQTEVGQPGQSLRFRPVYYLLRLVECALWGANPWLWYAFRLALLVFTLSLTWILIKPVTGFWLGGAFILSLLIYPYWTDLFTRLGPSETYAAPGVVIFALGMLQVLRQTRPSTPAWIWICLGTILCVGSKENLLIILLPLLFTAWSAWRNKKMNFTGWACLALSLGFILWITWAVAAALLKAGHDVYQNDAQPASRLSVLFSAFTTPAGAILTILVIALALLYLFHQPRGQKNIQTALFICIGLSVLYFSQFVFYNGVWPTRIRYDFPGMLYQPLLILCLGWLAVKTFGQRPFWKRWIRPAGYSFSIVIAAIVIIMIIPLTRGIVNEKVTQSRAFTEKITEISAALKNNPSSSLVISTAKTTDYEIVFSYAEFLQAYGVKNPIQIDLQGEWRSSLTGLSVSLANQLGEIEKNGGRGFQPSSGIHENCYILLLSGEPQSGCKGF